MTLHDVEPLPSPSETQAPVAVAHNAHKRTYSVLGRFQSGDKVTLTMVEIVERRGKRVTVDVYYVSPAPADFGRAFLWQGIAHKRGSRYYVNLGEEGGGEAPGTCECKGHLHRGISCRHIACTLALIQNGSL